MRSASSALTWRPVRIRSLARDGPTSRRQALRAAAAGDDAEQDLRLAEDGPLGGDPVVAGQRQLAPAAEGVAGRRRRSRCGGWRRRRRGPRGSWRRSPRASSAAAELADVGAGGEDPLAAGDDHRAGRVGGAAPRRPRCSSATQRAGERVDLRVVEGDDGDPVVAPFEVDQLVSHRRRRYAVGAQRAGPRRLGLRRRRRRAARRRPPTGRAARSSTVAPPARSYVVAAGTARGLGPRGAARRSRAAPRAGGARRRCSSWPPFSAWPRWSLDRRPQRRRSRRRRWRRSATIGGRQLAEVGQVEHLLEVAAGLVDALAGRPC